MSLVIVADDLSGAADCAIGFANPARRTVVALDPTRPVTGENAVIAVDTDTRRLAPADAARRALQAWRTFGAPGWRLYKKIDSTLRGNWAAEVAALQPLAGLAIVAPAFPETGRTVRDGRVYVQGVPLHETGIWQLDHAGRNADLQPMLQAACLCTRHVDVDALRRGPPALARMIAGCAANGIDALVVDAQTSADLQTLAQATLEAETALFWVGSGGLARELAMLPKLFDTEATGKPSAQSVQSAQSAQLRAVAGAAPAARDGAILVLVGSLSDVSARQCTVLRERAGIATLTVPPAILRASAEPHERTAWQAAIGARLSNREDLLLRIGRDDAFDPAEGARFSTALASLVAPHVAHLAGLIATGGETVRAMLDAAGVVGLEMRSEIEPGVALSVPTDTDTDTGMRRFAIVTKAGGFGNEHTLYNAWRYLHGRRASPGKLVNESPNPIRSEPSAAISSHEQR